MAGLIAYFLLAGIILTAVLLTVFRANSIYLFMDFAIITFFFVYGTINEWDRNSWHITGYCMYYILIRLLVAVILFIIMKYRKIKISFASRSIAGKIIVIIDVCVNLILYFPLLIQMWGAA